MFPATYFPPGYFPPRYFPEVGGDIVVISASPGTGMNLGFWMTPGLPPMGTETITVSSVPVKGDPSLYVQQRDCGGSKYRISATLAMLTVDTNEIRLRDDGVDADASTGHLLVDGDLVWLVNQQEIRNLSMIRALGIDATVTITYFGT